MKIVEVNLHQSLEVCLARSYSSPLSSPDMIHRILRPKTSLVALVAATLAIAATACGTLTGVPASLDTIIDSGTIYAINGAPPGAPTALYLFGGTLIAADANFVFDIAFDIDSAGHIVVLPQRAVASGLATTHTVALQTSGSTYDGLGQAPKNGYRADTAAIITPGQVIVVQSQDPNACSTSITGTTLYGKVVVDSMNAASRKLFIRYTTDPNCGFFSFAAGLPKD
jgi:hypothetical protein